MAYNKGYKKGGSGGKLGHSNMSHWDYTEVIKLHSKKARRLEEKEIIKSAIDGDDEGIIANQGSIILEEKPINKKRSSNKRKKRQTTSYMSQKQVDELIEILSKEKIHFYYFKDYYGFLLLSYKIGDGLSINKIRKTTFSRLLNKPIIQKIISNTGGCLVLPPKIGKISQAGQKISFQA